MPRIPENYNKVTVRLQIKRAAALFWAFIVWFGMVLFIVNVVRCQDVIRVPVQSSLDSVLGVAAHQAYQSAVWESAYARVGESEVKPNRSPFVDRINRNVGLSAEVIESGGGQWCHSFVFYTSQSAIKKMCFGEKVCVINPVVRTASTQFALGRYRESFGREVYHGGLAAGIVAQVIQNHGQGRGHVYWVRSIDGVWFERIGGNEQASDPNERNGGEVVYRSRFRLDISAAQLNPRIRNGGIILFTKHP
jgi:hypothetical protein